ncbi:MAG TPA: ABC transporter permease [Lacipirellulaceae bacterium]|jgi:ribose transport system permease protein|nr:ABC transporter permease [Lacipirellulaceae bacterium]
MTSDSKTGIAAGAPSPNPLPKGEGFQRFSPQGAKIWGIFGLLLAICLYTGFSSDRFVRVGNLENLVHRTALFGILSIGAAFVIITGGIDLSTGSLVCLVGVLLPYLLVQHGWPVVAAVVAVLSISVAAGVVHGLLITKLRLQPFVVTLCGLLLYRGVARGLTGDQSQGFGVQFKSLRAIATSRLPIFGADNHIFHLPATTLILIIIAIVAAVFLNKTIYGRYLLALGSNPEAARYSGINVDRTTLLAYVICSTLGGLGGMLFVLDINAAQPSDFGNFYELYAIAAAVLGGCSLRGGDGSILGVVIGAAVMVVLNNAINLVHPAYQNIEFAIIGGVILIGVIVDELARRFVTARREAARHAGR